MHEMATWSCEGIGHHRLQQKLSLEKPSSGKQLPPLL
ncbi:hypothetical protein TIFTF001_033145 [Ficus carica]|uniref:Uncharacterized protein n=1 Tax=Ficus carica TaxID=3494 RepID=A0AA88DYK5_FICCA|nr:hypothetical protein TIFTF001_033145 [Ficus carica]